MAIAPYGIMPDALIERGMRGAAFQWVLAQPQEADWKLQLWAGWRIETGARFDRGEYDRLASAGWRPLASGDDTSRGMLY